MAIKDEIIFPKPGEIQDRKSSIVFCLHAKKPMIPIQQTNLNSESVY